MAISDSDVETLAKRAKRTRTDEGSVEERSVQELIDADRYTKQSGLDAVPWGMRIARTRPGGTVVAVLLAVFLTASVAAAQQPGISPQFPAASVDQQSTWVVMPVCKLFPWNWGPVYRVRQRPVFSPQAAPPPVAAAPAAFCWRRCPNCSR